MLYGGVPINRHEQLLANTPPDVVIGTPGRLLDLVNRKKLDLSNVKHFVLDECDKMLAEVGTKEATRVSVDATAAAVRRVTGAPTLFPQTCAPMSRRSSSPRPPRSRS